MDWTIFLLTVLTLVLLGVLNVKKKFRYWKDRGVPYVKPVFPYGTLKGMGSTKHSSEVFQKAYNELKGKNAFGGIFFFIQPVILATDLNFLKNILVKDFQYFTDRFDYINERDDPLSAHLVALKGDKWKGIRTKVSPTFTSGKMKMMHSTIVAVAKEFQNYLEPHADSESDIEFKDVLARFTTDIFGTCALGIECNSLKDPNAEFRRIGERIFEFTNLDILKMFFLTAFPNFGRRFRMKINKPDVSEFFFRVLKDTIEYRETNNIKRNDLLMLLMQIMKTGKLEGDDTELGKITFKELTAQVYAFFVGGFETSSSTMTFALYELARHQDIQNRARDEILQVLSKYKGEYTYEACMEMKYLDRVINETLRRYPVVDVITRVCNQDYHVPDTSHVIEKGSIVAIPFYSIHNDPDIYPEPEKFNVDRFTEDNIKSRHPYAWMPFGEGPRVCVGMRFGMMQTRLGLAHVLGKYKVLLSSKTSVPVSMDPRKFFLSPTGGMWLKLEKL
ncbi:Cytochrome P450 [Sergentomyia squamirostris]